MLIHHTAIRHLPSNAAGRPVGQSKEPLVARRRPRSRRLVAGHTSDAGSGDSPLAR